MSDKPAAGNQQPPVRIGPSVPEIYVDGYQGVSFKDGVVKLNLYSLQLDPASNATYKDIVCRATMSTNTLLNIHAALGGLIKDLQAANAIAGTPPAT